MKLVSCCLPTEIHRGQAVIAGAAGSLGLTALVAGIGVRRRSWDCQVTGKLMLLPGERPGH